MAPLHLLAEEERSVLLDKHRSPTLRVPKEEHHFYSSIDLLKKFSSPFVGGSSVSNLAQAGSLSSYQAGVKLRWKVSEKPCKKTGLLANLRTELQKIV